MGLLVSQDLQVQAFFSLKRGHRRCSPLQHNKQEHGIDLECCNDRLFAGQDSNGCCEGNGLFTPVHVSMKTDSMMMW